MRRQRACATLGQVRPSLLAAAVLALAAPGTAAAAGLSLASTGLHGGGPIAVKRFQLVGLHWRGSGKVLFRTRSAGGRWSSWRSAAPGEDDLPDRGTEGRQLRGWRLGAPYWTGTADHVQYRTVGRVRAVRAFFVRGPVRGRSFRQPDFTDEPTIVTRAQWHAPESIRRAPPIYADGVHLVFIHHTAGSNSYSASQSASIVRAIMLYHVQANGWNDIGYNFLVDKYGQIFEGRYGGMTRPVIGAHAMGFNAGSAGIALIGNYSSAPVSAAAKAALVSLIAWRLDLGHVDPLSRVVRISAGNPRYPPGTAVTLNAIAAHRDVYPTSCPGNSLYRQLPSIRAQVAQTGLPKIYAPQVAGALGGPVRFTARLSAAADWTVTVKDQAGTVVASGAGTGSAVDWTWDASAASQDQRYTWAISVPDARSATGTLGAALPPPTLGQVKVVPPVVLPNAGAAADHASLVYRLNVQSMVTADLVDGAGATVAELFHGLRRAGRQSFVWKNVSVPDGRYQILLSARNARSQETHQLVPVAVDRTLGPFTGSATAFSPGAGRQLVFRFSLFGPADVQLRIMSGTSPLVSVLEAELNAGPQRVVWDGSGPPDGRYTALLSSTDAVVTAQQSVPLILDRVPPVLRLVSMSSLRFRISEPARVTLILNGRARHLQIRRAGVFRVGYRGTIRSLRAFAVDAAANRSRVIRGRR